MEFIAETYTPKTPWRDVPILKVNRRIQSVNCTFERHAYPSGGFIWYLMAKRRRKEVVGRKIQMVTLEIRGNSMWGNTQNCKILASGELPKYEIFQHVFQDFSLDTEKKLRTFL